MQKRAHISFDDVFATLRWLRDNRPDSIYDMHFWGTLRYMHEQYGAVFSLYAFRTGENFDISMLPDVYCRELYEASDWLRFGFHSDKYGESALGISGDTFCKSYKGFVNAMTKVTPAEQLCKRLRLHNWAATDEQISVLKSFGVTALLCRDKEGISYNLTQMETDLLNKTGVFEKEKMMYIRTDICYDDCTDASNRISSLIADGKQEIVLFGHEQHFAKCVDGIEQSIKQLGLNGYKFFSE
jgi:hypothetical protein